MIKPRFPIFVIGLLAVSACASTGPAPTPTTEIQQGEVILSEVAPATDTTGANAAVSIGAAVVGALIPGPWGSVASIASGTAGRAAVSGETGGTMRYYVKMADGSTATIEQPRGAAFASGTPINVIAMSDGSSRVVQRPIVPASEVTAAPAPSTVAE